MSWIGDCERCGSCCGLESAIVGSSGYAPGMSFSKMFRGSDAIVDAIKAAYLAKEGVAWDGESGFQLNGVRIIGGGGGGPVQVDMWISDDGIWTSSTNKKCPYLSVGTPNECLIWNKDYVPEACRGVNSLPKVLTNPLSIGKWVKAHPPVSAGGNCTIEWVE